MFEFAFDLGPLHLRLTLSDQAADDNDGEPTRESAADSLVEHASDWRHPDHELDSRPLPLGFRA